MNKLPVEVMNEICDFHTFTNIMYIEISSNEYVKYEVYGNFSKLTQPKRVKDIYFSHSKLLLACSTFILIPNENYKPKFSILKNVTHKKISHPSWNEDEIYIDIGYWEHPSQIGKKLSLYEFPTDFLYNLLLKKVPNDIVWLILYFCYF